MQSINKLQLRKAMLERRLALSTEEIESKSSKVSEKFFALNFTKLYHTFMVFMSFKNEIDTKYILEYLLQHNKRVVLPRIEKTSNTMQAFAVTNLEKDLQEGCWGIREPRPGLPLIPPQEIDLVIVPGVAFDKKCYRLGYGGGYYDRFFLQTQAFKLGIGYDFQIVDRLPIEEWDIQLDSVITDTTCFTKEGI